MRDLTLVRSDLAESGLEFTPKELSILVKKIKKIHKFVSQIPDFNEMTKEERQEVCRTFAEKGKEMSPSELDEIIEIGSAIREIEF